MTPQEFASEMFLEAKRIGYYPADMTWDSLSALDQKPFLQTAMAYLSFPPNKWPAYITRKMENADCNTVTRICMDKAICEKFGSCIFGVNLEEDSPIKQFPVLASKEITNEDLKNSIEAIENLAKQNKSLDLDKMPDLLSLLNVCQVRDDLDDE